MFLVGLGNPDQEYQQTRHNVGRMFLDFLAEKWGLGWKKRKDLLSLVAKEDGLWLVKPQVFMNESGRAVRKATEKMKGELYLVHDELDLELGSWRLTFGKSSPLHKGVLSVEKYLETKDFWRIRIGIDNRLDRRIPGEKYVLQRFTPEEREILKGTLDKIEKKILFWLRKEVRERNGSS